MSFEEQPLITHFPTDAELAASRPNENAVNFRDPAQLAAINAARVELGYAAVPPPGEYVISIPPKAEHVPVEAYIEPEEERTLNAAEMAKLRAEVQGNEGTTRTILGGAALSTEVQK